jgi:hypothetical protein
LRGHCLPFIIPAVCHSSSLPDFRCLHISFVIVTTRVTKYKRKVIDSKRNTSVAARDTFKLHLKPCCRRRSGGGWTCHRVMVDGYAIVLWEGEQRGLVCCLSSLPTVPHLRMSFFLPLIDLVPMSWVCWSRRRNCILL